MSLQGYKTITYRQKWWRTEQKSLNRQFLKSLPLWCSTAELWKAETGPFWATWMVQMSQGDRFWQLDTWHWGHKPPRSSWAQRGFAHDPNSAPGNKSSHLFHPDSASFLEVFLAQFISARTFIKCADSSTEEAIIPDTRPVFAPFIFSKYLFLAAFEMWFDKPLYGIRWEEETIKHWKKRQKESR